MLSEDFVYNNFQHIYYEYFIFVNMVLIICNTLHGNDWVPPLLYRTLGSYYYIMLYYIILILLHYYII